MADTAIVPAVAFGAARSITELQQFERRLRAVKGDPVAALQVVHDAPRSLPSPRGCWPRPSARRLATDGGAALPTAGGRA